MAVNPLNMTMQEVDALLTARLQPRNMGKKRKGKDRAKTTAESRKSKVVRMPSELLESDAYPHDYFAWGRGYNMTDDRQKIIALPPLNAGTVQGLEMEDHGMNTDVDVLDPDESPRQYHRHQYTGNQREIWRPGDGDGNPATDYYDRRGPPLPIDKRWRLFQSDIGQIAMNKALPPKFVLLDDRAVWEVIHSDISKARISQWWPHDFAQQAKLRNKRTHYGRPAIKDDAATGNEKFQSTALGKTGARYYFTGEKDYKPVVYRIKTPTPPTEAEEIVSRKRRAESPEEYNPRAHGHNQYTPKELQVKHGAPSKKKMPEKVHNLPALPRPNAPYLNGTVNPIHVERRLYGGIEENAKEFVRREANKAVFREGSVQSAEAATRSSAAAESPDDLSTTNGPAEEPAADLVVTQVPSSTSTPSAHSPPPTREPGQVHVEIPRIMGFLERRDIENRITNQVLQGIQTEPDVQRIAKELATEKINVAQQAKEIESLGLQLNASREEIERLREAVDKALEEANVAEAQVEERDGEIEELKRELHELKHQNVELELKIDTKNEEIKKLQQNGGSWGFA